MIPDVGIAELASGLVESTIDRLPGIGRGPFDPYGAGCAVKVALRIAIIFELAVERENLLEAPFGVTPCGPFVEIFWRAAQRDMAVDGRRPACNFAARIGDLAIGSSFGDEAPVVRTRRDPGVQQIGRSLIDGRIVGAGFE